jgi:hypothetical protein
LTLLPLQKGARFLKKKKRRGGDLFSRTAKKLSILLVFARLPLKGVWAVSD